MTVYTAICSACTTKRFITPGTEDTSVPLHDTFPDNGGAQLDADHVAVPQALSDPEVQRAMLTRVARLVAAHAPDVAAIELSTLDQSDGFGFFLCGLLGADGEQLLPGWPEQREHPLPGDVLDQIDYDLVDLDWDGVVGESYTGYARIEVARWASAN